MPENFEQQIQSLSQRLKILEEKVSTTNVTLSQFFTNFAKYQTDATTFYNDQTAFNASLQTFLTSLAAGSGGTVLSAADQQTLNGLNASLTTLDGQADTLNTAVGSITLPSAPTSGT
jgi:hypothetical protein